MCDIFEVPSLVLFAEEDRENNNITRKYKGTLTGQIGCAKIIAYEPRNPETNKAWCAVSAPGEYYKVFSDCDSVITAWLLGMSDGLRVSEQ